MNCTNIPTFVISLKESQERRDWISKQLGDMGIEFEFFDAVDGRSLDAQDYQAYNRKKRLRYFGRDMKGGEIGCLLSHKRIYEKIVDNNLEMALILEDDVILKESFVRAIKEISKIGDKFEIARFLGSPKVAKHKRRKITHLFDDYWIVRIPTTPGGAHAYVITQKGAKSMLKVMDKNYLPIDTLIGHAWKTKIRSYIIQPGLAVQDLSMESSIGEERFDKSVALSGIEKALFPITRGWFKFCEAVGKKWVWLTTYFKEKS